MVLRRCRRAWIERTIGRPGGGHQDPVADDRQIRGGQRQVTQPPAHFGKPLELAVDRVEAALLLDDPRDAQVAAADDVRLLLEERRPSEVVEGGHGTQV